MKNLLFFILLMAIAFQLLAQQTHPLDQFLRLEKINAAKTKRLYVGDKVRYKTVFNDWKSGKIEQLDFLNQTVHFSSGPVRLQDITGIQTQRQANWAKYIRLKFQTLGIGILFFSVFNPLVGLPYPVWALAAGPGAYGLGWLLGELLEKNFYRIGSRWRVRMMDLSFD